MPKNTQTLPYKGFKNRILDANPGINDKYAERCAKRIARRAAMMQERFDFFESCRVLGIYSDPTARVAVHHTECTAEECSVCGRVKAVA